jgi:hypothetical protein
VISTFSATKHLEAQPDRHLRMTLQGKLINMVPAIAAQRSAMNQEVHQPAVEAICVHDKPVYNHGKTCASA